MISVILPIYNTKEYLPQCLDSLIHQTYKELEIICIDDGSSDGSEKIVDDYAKKDDRLRVVHQENQGESYARNVGLKLAKGDCIAFCDCDDWIEPDMYESLYSAMEEDNLDIAAGGWCKAVLENNIWVSHSVRNKKEVTTDVFDRGKLLRYLYERDSYRGFSYMWNKLYKKEVLMGKEKNVMLFDENLRLGGDVLYLARAALNASRVKYIDKDFYHYRMRKESGSHTVNMDSYRDWIKSYEMAISLYEKEKIDKEIIDYLKRFLGYHAYEAAGVAFDTCKIDEYKYFREVMLSYQEVYERMNASHPNRIEDYRKRMELLNEME
ncbi:MAG: glycosyltransferase [Lachnospiraceae bacterium]|nr:glycosyltransferase [Lachnospiraceae bacterium]